MARHRNRDSRTYEEEDKQDIRRQEGIFLYYPLSHGTFSSHSISS